MTISEINIRRATLEDAAALRELRLEALQNRPEAFGSDYEKESRQPLAQTEDSLRDEMNLAIFIATAESKLIGMTGIGKYRHTKLKHGAFVWGVYVQPAWRGQGVSQQIMQACIQWGREHGLQFIKLAVINTNAPAINSYLRSGFRVYGVDPRVILYNDIYYDELLMVKDL
jgi:RimJ/RimL family protein N-acetyltransferase